MDIIKYPRTQHIAGSRLQKGDEDLQIVPVQSLYGKHVVIEEKMDGANSGISFDCEENLCLQSRGHYLLGGPRETQFALFKQWATTHRDALFLALGDRHIVYGEWMYSKHTVFYDALPHYWMEFDVFDRTRQVFLDTPARQAIFNGVAVLPVRIIYSGVMGRNVDLKRMIGKSEFKSPDHAQSLRSQCEKRGYDFDRVAQQTDMTGLMEGLYIKVEEDGIVRERYKFVRNDFVNLIIEGEEHHMDRPIVPNLLRPGVDIFAD